MDSIRKIEARSIRLTGHVQGVGFRPFVYRLAEEHAVTGWVQNQLGEVEVFAEGPAIILDAFQRDLIDKAPPLARPALGLVNACPADGLENFSIRASEATHEPEIHVPPDFFTCDDCVQELHDPSDRRYRYPFINCTQCGPRYTLIEAMPYDRPNTSMAGFPLCADCLAEYEDPTDRRFHAEPVACPECGPSLAYKAGDGVIEGDNEAALTAALDALRSGAILAVKGVGGYHLMCDAADDEAIARLRSRKPRPDKPLALMYPATGTDGLDALRDDFDIEPTELEHITQPDRPIVLLRSSGNAALSDLVAPGLSEIGVMLPYSPLHHLLLGGFGRALVATSGNISGEPVLTNATDAEQRLDRIVDGYLHHDRPIVRPADDSVLRRISGRMTSIRLGRGAAPLEVELPIDLPTPVLAVGGHMKNTVAIGWGRRLVVSPHIGDMGTTRSLQVFERVTGDLQALYGVEAKAVLCDAHPDYVTTRWARRQSIPAYAIPHHFAHASAASHEWPKEAEGIVFTWDGVGFGPDETLWGGEALAGRPGAWRRVATMRSFRLPGGERAGREPWRSAAAVAWETGSTIDDLPDGAALAHQAWIKDLNCPTTTAMGRLFDAAAAMLGICRSASFEGQGPMELEALARKRETPVDLPLSEISGDLLVTDWEPLIAVLSDTTLGIEHRAGIFHASMAAALVRQAEHIRSKTGLNRIAFGGGVFQNRLLTELCLEMMASRSFDVTPIGRLPVNDGGLSAGQVVEFAGGARTCSKLS